MKFVIQSDQGIISDLDLISVSAMLKDCRFQHTYRSSDIEGVGHEEFLDHIPVGSLPFVGRWLKINHGILTMNPIEVPVSLREEKFLGRDYRIVRGADIPKVGDLFIKDVSALKAMSFLGPVENLHKCSVLKDDTLYQVSERIDIISEYRIFISDMEIEAICLYNGDCTIFPNVPLLQEMKQKYYLSGAAPESYTIDVAVLKDGRTVILEIHPVTSVGLYGYVSRNLAYMYKDGIDYYITKNIPLTV